MFPLCSWHGAVQLFPETLQQVTDEELVVAIRAAVQGGGRLSRMADLYLSAVCAEHLFEELRRAGLRVVRHTPEQFPG